jgi:SsrA-binding protein
MAKADRATKQKPDGKIVVASNRRARHDFDIIDTVEAGLVLHGSEVKSLRESKVQIAEAYARIRDHEAWLLSFHIGPYSHAAAFGHDPDRPKKLLMHRGQIDRLGSRLDQEPLTLVPLSLYFKDGRAKVELGLARRRNKGDKRQAIAERDAARDAQRAMSDARRGER